MNQELLDKEIIEQELKEYLDGAYADYGSAKDQLERFAKVVAAAEREACAVLCDAEQEGEGEWYGCSLYLAEKIRARGE